jgi:uncharacterized protein YndB with AHSA1/START domain
MKIDENAPLQAHQDVFISAPIEKVWNVQTDIERWSDWQPGVTFAKLDGELAVDSRFRWRTNGFRLTSIIQELDHHRRMSWTGRGIGIQVIHIWVFSAEDGGTRVTIDESLGGWMSRLLKLFNKSFLEDSLEKSLETLKAQLEKS